MISEDYKTEQQNLHKNNPNYGVMSVHYAPMVTKLINQLGITELLDYGAGKGRLAGAIKPDHEVKVRLYDPGIAELDKTPDSSQFVTCIDVLEHIEPEYLDAVLDDLQRVTEFFGFFTIHTGPAVKTLSDGRNAHLTQEPSAWWLPKIQQRFDLLNFQIQPNGFYVVVRPYGN
jgi:2-polyprenyl-3-methyl-5-hydroxy-6-metoxy-1,4-benzoquinol methylase